MSPKNDQVFQLSLTEIFIIICFILLILMGFRIVQLSQDNKQLEAKRYLFQDLSQKEIAIKTAAADLKLKLTALGAKNPDEIISRLIDVSKVREESERLKILIQDKDDKITALASVEKILAQVNTKDKGKEAKKLILQTLMSYEQLKKLVVDKADEKDLSPDELVKRIAMLQATDKIIKEALNEKSEVTLDQLKTLVSNAEAFKQASENQENPVVLHKANKDLRGQIQYLQNRLNSGRGVDLPPCWVNEQTGKVEMLFTLELREDSVTLEPAWPQIRQEDAIALPGISNLLENRTKSYNDFMQSVKQINDYSKLKECRFYVRLASLIPDAVTSDRRRLTIETVFYKTEVRR